MSNFSPNAQGVKNWAGSGTDFFDDWSTGMNRFRSAAEDVTGDAYRLTQNTMNLKNQGTDDLYNQAYKTLGLQTIGLAQGDASMRAFEMDCDAIGWSSPQCQAVLAANNMQRQQTQTGSTFTPSTFDTPNYSFAANALRLGGNY
jgi:hypothetical protein